MAFDGGRELVGYEPEAPLRGPTSFHQLSLISLRAPCFIRSLMREDEQTL